MSPILLLYLDAYGQLVWKVAHWSPTTSLSAPLIGRSSAETLVSDLFQAFESQALAREPLAAIYWTHGPGSFFGIRSLASVVQTFSWLWNTPVVAINGLQHLAHLTRLHPGFVPDSAELLVFRKAGAKRVYFGHYQQVEDARPAPALQPERMLALADLDREPAWQSWIAKPERARVATDGVALSGLDEPPARRARVHELSELPETLWFQALWELGTEHTSPDRSVAHQAGEPLYLLPPDHWGSRPLQSSEAELCAF